jgi:hypothetical protein
VCTIACKHPAHQTPILLGLFSFHHMLKTIQLLMAR